MWGDDTIFIYFFVDSQSHFRDRALRENLSDSEIQSLNLEERSSE